MPRIQVQVSKDQGRTWKYRWIDQSELDPEKSLLKPGDYTRLRPGTRIMVITMREGRLNSKPLEDSDKLMLFSYEFAGHTIELQAEHQSEADYFLVQRLIAMGLLQRREII